jgi:hypothetical protein
MALQPNSGPGLPLWGFVTINFLQGLIVSPAPNPHPGGPGLRIYDSRGQGGPAILAAFYDIHGLQWDYSLIPITTRDESNRKFVVIVHVDGVISCLWTVSTNRPVVHHPYDTWLCNPGEMMLKIENRRTRRTACLNASLSTANHTWTRLGANPDLRSERQATNCLGRL